MDEDGNDDYVASRYAQGAGIHFSVGVLRDGDGNDRYESWAVSQGIGHDFGVGVLVDGGGDDVYRARTLAQGAGNADGLGMLIDLGGDDRYVADGEDVQGHGAAARRSQSLGFLIDLDGRDSYSGRGRNNAQWASGEYGGGFDADDRRATLGFALAPAPWTGHVVVRPASPELALNFQRPSDASVRSLDPDETAARELLLEAIDPDESPAGAGRREAARARIEALGARAIPALVTLLRSLDSSVAAETLQILVVLGERAHPALLERMDPDPGVRERAAEGLGRARAPRARDVLEELLARDPSVSVRHAAVQGLRHLAEPGVEEILAAALDDPAFPVRLAARRALRERGA